MRKFLSALAVTAAVVIAGTACEEKAAEVSHKADSDSSVVKDEAAPATPEPEPIVVDDAADTVVDEPEPEVEPAETTAVVGDTVEVGDWSVTVTEVALNANEVIHRANQFNEQPKGQYVLVTYDATYQGGERTADAYMDLTWSLTGSDNKIHDEAYAVTPADNDEWPTEARKGGTVTVQVTFDVKPDVLTGAILSVEGYDANFDSTYADFAL